MKCNQYPRKKLFKLKETRTKHQNKSNNVKNLFRLKVKNKCFLVLVSFIIHDSPTTKY